MSRSPRARSSTAEVKSRRKPVLAFVSDSVYPFNKGGKEVRLHELTTRLAAAGFEVHIYTMQWWEGGGEHVESGVRMHAISRLYPLYAGERRSIKQGLFFGLACFKLLRARFDRVDVDHMPYFPLYSMRIVCWFRRVPMSATWHEVWGRGYWQEYLGRYKGLMAYAIERGSVLLPDAVFAVSPMTARKLKADLGYRGPLTVIPNGVDTELLSGLAPARHGADILYAGRLLSHKNVDVLIAAVAELKSRGRDVSCLIIGDGPERQNLMRQARSLGLRGTVSFRSFLPDQTGVFKLMKASRIFVLPSTREGFGISLIEANACGLPVLTVDHPDNAAKDLVRARRTGLVTRLDPREMADRLEELLDSGHDADAIVAHAGRYRWSAAAGKFRRTIA